MKTIKTIGLGILAVLAVAVFPTAASAAQGFAADAYPAEVKGKTVGYQTVNLPSSGAGGFQCNTSVSVADLPASSNSLVSTVSDASCWYFANQPTLSMNGCGYEYHPASETVDIGPAGCGPMKINLSGCEISIGAQTGLAAEFTNTGSGKEAFVEVELNSGGLKYTAKGGGGWFCNPGTYTDGTIDATWNLKATSIGAMTGLHVEEIAKGVFLAGKESGTPSEQPRIEAESYPVRMLGEQLSTSPLQFKLGGNVSCNQAHLLATPGAATSDLSVDAEYAGCTAFGNSVSATIKMNSCDYHYGVSNAGPPYAGTWGVSCSAPGDAIEVKTSICVAKIGPQSGLTGVSYANSGEGVERRFEAQFSISGIQFTLQKLSFLCPYSAGSFSNGTLSGAAEFRGLK